MIKNLIFGVYLLISDFLVESLNAKEKLAKKITPFTIKLRSKNLLHFTNVNSLNIIKNILPQHSQKHDSGWCQKKYLYCTISRHAKTAFSDNLESKFLYVHVNLRSKIFVPDTNKEPFICWGAE